VTQPVGFERAGPEAARLVEASLVEKTGHFAARQLAADRFVAAQTGAGQTAAVRSGTDPLMIARPGRSGVAPPAVARFVRGCFAIGRPGVGRPVTVNPAKACPDLPRPTVRNCPAEAALSGRPRASAHHPGFFS